MSDSDLQRALEMSRAMAQEEADYQRAIEISLATPQRKEATHNDDLDKQYENEMNVAKITGIPRHLLPEFEEWKETLQTLNPIESKFNMSRTQILTQSRYENIKQILTYISELDTINICLGATNNEEHIIRHNKESSKKYKIHLCINIDGGNIQNNNPAILNLDFNNEDDKDLLLQFLRGKVDNIIFDSSVVNKFWNLKYSKLIKLLKIGGNFYIPNEILGTPQIYLRGRNFRTNNTLEEDNIQIDNEEYKWFLYINERKIKKNVYF